ncbi:MAG: uracil-DNA glycosylase [Verrucomicrobiota bacterium]
MSDAFLPSLDFVLAALKARRDAGVSLKASAGSLVGLASATPAKPQSVPVSQVPHKAAGSQIPSPTKRALGGATESLAPSPKPPELKEARPAAPRAIGGDKALRLAALRSEALGCLLCPNLVQSRSSVVFGEGNPDAELMLVGEAPGADEDLRGEPFVGAAGELLGKILTAMGMSRDEVYIANVLKCRPDVPLGSAGNRKPTTEEMGRCLPFLHQQIAIVQPRVMVALGATAMQGLFGKTEPMARLRSNWYAIQDIPVMATYHPSYLLRNQALSEKRKVWEDLLQVLERLERPISAKQRGFFLKSGG